LDRELEQRFLNEIENQEIDTRPQELQDLEKRLEDEGNAFVKNGTDSSSALTSNTNTQLSEAERLKLYFEGIKELNEVLLDQLISITIKINTNDFDSSIDMIPILSQAMRCRIKVVSTINRIQAVFILNPLSVENKREWMSLREEMVKLMQRYRAIEMNVEKHLTSLNQMLLSPDSRNADEVRKVTDYFTETIEESTFLSLTEDIFKKIQVLAMKPGSIHPLHRELLLEYFNVCQREMRDKLKSEYLNKLNQLHQEMNTIRSTLDSSNDLDEIVAKTFQATEVLMDQRIITESDAQPLHRFMENIQETREQEL